MTTQIRARGTSLGVRLGVLVAVPIATLSIFAVGHIDAERAHADDVAALVETIELQQAVAGVYPQAQLERIALEGLARIDELGLPRGIVVEITGADLESFYRANQTELDDSLAALDAEFGDVVLSDGHVLGDHLAGIRSDMDVQRRASEQRRATTDGVQSVYEALSAVLDDTLATARDGRGSAGVGDERFKLDTLTDVVSSAGERARTLMRGVLYQTPELQVESVELTATHRAYLASHRSTLAAADQARVDQLAATDAALPQLPPATGLDPSNALSDTDLIIESAQVVLAHLDYLSRLRDYSADFHDRAVVVAEARAASARADVRRTAGLIVAIALLTAILTGLVVLSVLRPIWRLTKRAAAIGNGELEHEPLPSTGPRDLRTLVDTTNDMVATLNRMHDQIGLFANGDLDAEPMAELPGAIGVTMRESVQRLARVTAQLHRSEQFASAVVDEAADAIWTVDDDGRIRTANAAAVRVTGVAIGDQLGHSLDDVVPTINGEATLTTAAGEAVRVLVVNSVVDVGGERIMIVIAHDISERARFEERLNYLANHDALTGLPNRFSLLHHLEQRLETGDVAVLFVDLDGFKNVNDSLGHAVGDQLLATLARDLARCVGQDEFIGRLGGDEFVIVAGRAREVAAIREFGERIIREIERPHDIGDQAITLSASVGIALPAPGTAPLDTIRQADNAVYQAKRRGRGRVELYDAALQHQVEHQAELELALRGAVRDGELSLHLQPVHDLRDDRFIGAEALVRWNRPGHGLVPPAEFIPVAERSSLIFDIERWVLREACGRAADWRRRDPDCQLRIAVNISGRHLIDGDLLGDVVHALESTGADPRMLELELTETQLLEDLQRATTVLDELRVRGITIAVDDFGTGYSSLNYLRHLPIDAVKIDRSFVARATEHGYDATVIDALLTISRSLELKVVAEGVETDDQLQYLRDRGCDRAQGYLIARPLPSDEAEALLFETARVPAETH